MRNCWDRGEGYETRDERNQVKFRASDCLDIDLVEAGEEDDEEVGKADCVEIEAIEIANLVCYSGWQTHLLAVSAGGVFYSAEASKLSIGRYKRVTRVSRNIQSFLVICQVKSNNRQTLILPIDPHKVKKRY